MERGGKNYFAHFVRILFADANISSANFFIGGWESAHIPNYRGRGFGS